MFNGIVLRQVGGGGGGGGEALYNLDLPANLTKRHSYLRFGN